MEKAQIIFGILILLLVFPVTFLVSEPFSIPVYGKKKHIDLRELESSFPELEFKENPAILILEIRGNNRWMRIRSGSSFYILDGKVQKIPAKILYSQKKFLVPPDVVEAIFLHLVSYEVFYEYKDDKLVLDIRSRASTKDFLPVRAVVIDPGHGGKDPGTMDIKGNMEKDIALRVSLSLEKALASRYPDLIVKMTRRTDEFVSLEARSGMANRLLRDMKEVLFISIHCNSALSPIPRGFEIYYLSQTATTELEREVAIRENRILDSRYPSPIPSIQSGLLSSLVQRRSRNLAYLLEKEMVEGIGKLIPSRGVKKANFSVLRGSLMPAILIEMGYLSHPKESVYLNSSKVQKRIVESIIRGMEAYGQRKD